MVRRFRIQKCCSLCGKWELRDRHRPHGKQVIRVNSHAQAIRRMSFILVVERMQPR